MAATTSMNGWSLIATASGDLESITAGGLSTKVRAGDVATVLEYVARAFHSAVEPLVTFHGWRSVATNTAVGGHPRSNHPSGTAIDCNGARHPRYRAGTFTAAQVSSIRGILAACAPVVRWGGDWGADIDEMHFEVVGTPAQVAAVARRLPTLASNTTSTGAVSGVPTLTAPTPLVSQEDTVLALAKLKTSADVYVGDGITRRHVTTQAELSDIQSMIRAGVLRGDPIVHEVT